MIKSDQLITFDNTQSLIIDAILRLSQLLDKITDVL